MTWPTRLHAVLVTVLLAACGGVRPPATSVPVAAGEPWGVPGAELGTQRLLRAELDTPDGGARLRLTLRLAEGSYQLIAADALGRAVWTVHVEGERATFLDHRSSFWCEARARDPLRALPLGAPLDALPAVLLGRLPLAPSGDVERDGERMHYLVVGGRRLDAELRGGAVERWTLWGETEPEFWWTATGDGGVLTARRERVVLRWQQVVREPLPSPLVAPAIPPTLRRGTCDEAPAPTSP